MSVELQRDRAREIVEGLRRGEDELVAALVDDGWSEQMARHGLALHWKSWDVDRMAASVEAELQHICASPHHRLVWPRRVHHIWPALPGAGLAPVLVGTLLGLDQAVRPSGRGARFSRQLLHQGPWQILEGDSGWQQADLVVVSGSDETVEAVQSQMKARGRVVGYGHGVSFALVVDGEGVDLKEVALEVGHDVVMWHQRGCFSVRAVLFCGTQSRRADFCDALANAIAHWEQRWGTQGVAEGELAARAQALGVAEMRGDVWCQGLGYVRDVEQPFSGDQEAVHSVTVHPVAGPHEVDQMVSLARPHVQGVAVAGAWRAARERWLKALCSIGATCIAPAKTLQSPPAHWWHDGFPNALLWATVTTVIG